MNVEQNPSFGAFPSSSSSSSSSSSVMSVGLDPEQNVCAITTRSRANVSADILAPPSVVRPTVSGQY